MIPENHQDICRELAQIAQKHGLAHMNVTYRPGYLDPWQSEIAMGWEAGRHEANTNEIAISSTMHVHTTISEGKQ